MIGFHVERESESESEPSERGEKWRQGGYFFIFILFAHWAKTSFCLVSIRMSSPQPPQPPEPAPGAPPPPTKAASLQHTIVRTRDADATARLLSAVAGLRIGERWRVFLPLETQNGVALDLLQVEADPIAPQHYAFLTDDEGFDAGLQVLKSRKIEFWAHHTGAEKGKVNTLYGGRGLYFRDLASGHNIELITTIYGDPQELDEALEKLKLEEVKEKEAEEETKREK